MRVLLLADVHSNWPALKAVEADVDNADFVIHAGDTIGYYCYPDECTTWMREHADVNVMGNHDYALVSGVFRGFSAESRRVLAWTDGHLSAINLRYLSNLKDSWVGDVGGVKFGVIHGGVSDPLNEFIHAYSDEELINSYMRKLGVKVLVTGHLHQLFVRQVKEGLLINPGGAGQPRDHDSNPSYVLLDVNEGRVQTIMPKRVKYDVSELAARMASESLPLGFVDRLKAGE